MTMQRLVRDRSIRIAIVACFALVVSAADASGRQYAVAQGDGGAPRFLFAASRGETPVPVDAGSIPSLGRRIDLDLSDVTIDDALRAIASASRLQLVYSAQVVPVMKRVSVKASGITVAAALTEVLFKANVDVLLSGGRIVMVRGPKPLQVGTITGRVTDASTQEGLVDVTVLLNRTRWTATTDSGGRYRMTRVEAGTYTLVARRLGYASATQAVTVAADQEVTVDLVLQPALRELDAVVVTATGEQRLLELGHTVGRIKADSLVRESPISSLSDLLTSRVPGLMVFQNQGTVGGKVDLRLRGSNSLVIGPTPIVVVDGVRYTTELRPMGAASADGPGGGFGQISGPAVVEPTSPLNDINVNDIESVEVVKGPSAATLYGSDAANGVIVITTKRGGFGPARWNTYAKATTTEIPVTRFPDIYWGWGTVFGVPNNMQTSCTIAWLGLGVCSKQDSVTVLPNPLNDPQLSIFDSKARWQYGANVAGGQGDVRYYFSADFEDATGPIQMPPAIVEELIQQRGLSNLPDEWRNPNAFTRLNLRSNISTGQSSRADLRVSTGYVQASTRTVGVTGGPYGATLSTTPTAPYGGGGELPASSFLQTSTEEVKRFYGSATGRWRTLRWLETRATAGVDVTSSTRHSIARRGDVTSVPDGAVGEDQGQQTQTTAELGATARVQRGGLSWRTAVGVQYVRNLTNSVFTYGRDLPPGGTSVQQALSLESRHTYAAKASLGSYLEETVGFNDRLFLTGGLRLDGASTFGRDYQTALYPKLSASWLISEEPFVPRLPGLNELRLRYAFGAAGRQPLPRWARPQFFGITTVEDGNVVRAVVNSELGNPNLRPERVSEHEFGLDARVLRNRVSVGLTWFRRRAQDQILNFSLPPGLGTAYRNVGLTSQRGFESELTAALLDSRSLSLDVRFQHSSSLTHLVDLGDALASRDIRGGYVEGYPLGARFGRPVIAYEDRNGNGSIDFTEVTLSDTAVYLGQSLPPRAQTLTATAGLFNRALRLSALAERRAGFTQINPFACRFPGTCRAAVDLTTPLEQQAQAAGAIRGQLVEKGDFIRLREVSLAADLPAAAVRALRARSVTLVFSARNLALWTDFSGPDPESGRLSFESEAAAVRGNEASGVPLGRSYEIRFNLGF